MTSQPCKRVNELMRETACNFWSKLHVVPSSINHQQVSRRSCLPMRITGRAVASNLQKVISESMTWWMSNTTKALPGSTVICISKNAMAGGKGPKDQPSHPRYWYYSGPRLEHSKLNPLACFKFVAGMWRFGKYCGVQVCLLVGEQVAVTLILRTGFAAQIP